MRKRIIIGVLLCLGAAAQAGLAWHILNIAQDNKRLVEISHKKSDDLCRESVMDIGNFSENSDVFTIDYVLMPEEDWRVALMNASSVISRCSTRRMSYFCMGRSCGEIKDSETRLNLEEQNLSPSRSNILKTEPIKIRFQLEEMSK